MYYIVNIKIVIRKYHAFILFPLIESLSKSYVFPDQSCTRWWKELHIQPLQSTNLPLSFKYNWEEVGGTIRHYW